jgi:proteasome lid subunit RPN8/RPN11
MMRVLLPQGVRGQILHEARQARPNECCGLIEGARDGRDFKVIALHPARNLAASPEKFEIDPRDHFAAHRYARARRSAIIGCYHSHPGGEAEPSAYDQAGADEENFLWLIAADEALNAFVYLRGEFVGADCVTSSG